MLKTVTAAFAWLGAKTQTELTISAAAPAAVAILIM
jgi:hypothetical protein